jgi:4-amino-4-deoxy-L-arabinose transferase-like glycosyltransferase
MQQPPTSRFTSLLQLARRACSCVTPVLRSRWFIVVLPLLYLFLGFGTLQRNLANPEARGDLVRSDSQHYLRIARDFAAGDWSFSEVAKIPHRQPLYPLALGLAMMLGGENLLLLGSVNVVLAALAILTIHIFAVRLSGSRVVASLLALLLAFNPFLFEQSTTRLLTEPLHVLLMLPVCGAFVLYTQTRSPIALATLAIFAGLDYLARPNGLFVAASAFAVLLSWEALCFLRESGRRSAAWRFLRVAGAILLFLTVASPSWFPRWRYFGNPLEHGHLSNYLWTDDHEIAHSYRHRLTWRDYFVEHDATDAAKRMLYGIYKVFVIIPQSREDIPVLYVLAVFGAIAGLRQRRNEVSLLLLFFLMQIWPLVWTHISNSTGRLPYSAMLPFELFFAMGSVAWVAARIEAGPSSGSESPSTKVNESATGSGG